MLFYQVKKRIARKYLIYRMRKKLLMIRTRKELRGLFRQQPEEVQHRKILAKGRTSRRLIRASLNTPTILPKEEFMEMWEKLITEMGSIKKFYTLMESAMKDPPEETAIRQLAITLGSHFNLHRFIITFKQPKFLLPYIVNAFGGSLKAFNVIDKAMLGDVRSIYKIATYVGLDLKVTLRLLMAYERTVAAATDCLATKPCRFHHVEDYIRFLLKGEWTDADLIELANGRYVQRFDPGGIPNLNPLLTVATGMSENAFVRFNKALHELNYRYFKSLGNVQFEQPTYSK